MGVGAGAVMGGSGVPLAATTVMTTGPPTVAAAAVPAEVVAAGIAVLKTSVAAWAVMAGALVETSPVAGTLVRPAVGGSGAGLQAPRASHTAHSDIRYS